MLVRDFLDMMPLWAVFIGTVILMMGATEAGYQVGFRKNSDAGSEEDSRINAMTGAHLGLLAFILAFSFNLAAGHYSERKKLVLDEVNAIETSWLRLSSRHGDQTCSSSSSRSCTAAQAASATGSCNTRAPE